MARHIQNMGELAKAMEPVMKGLVDRLADEVYKALNFYLLDYYNGWTPDSYHRTMDFLYSAVKIHTKMVGNKCVASVYIDYDSMNSYVNATGYRVAQWVSSGLHGGLSVSHKPRVWDDTMDATVNNGNLLKSAAAYLSSKGFSVTM